MAYYPKKPDIKNPLQSKVITPELVAAIIKKGYPGYKNDPLENFGYFGYQCAKEDRFYTSILNENQFYRANHIRIFFKWYDAESDTEKYQDFYVVLCNQKIELRYWNRSNEDNKNQFEHHQAITELSLIKQIEKSFQEIVNYWGVNILETNDNKLLENTINKENVYKLLVLLCKKEGKEIQELAAKIAQAQNEPEAFKTPKEDLHLDLLMESDELENIIIPLDWKCEVDDIIWAIATSSNQKVILSTEIFDENDMADKNLLKAEKIIHNLFPHYTLMYLDIPGDSYCIFIAEKSNVKNIISLGEKCNIPLSNTL